MLLLDRRVAPELARAAVEATAALMLERRRRQVEAGDPAVVAWRVACKRAAGVKHLGRPSDTRRFFHVALAAQHAAVELIEYRERVAAASSLRRAIGAPSRVLL